MKLLIVLAFVACAFAEVSELGYSYPQPVPVQVPQNSYIPPAPPVHIEQPHNAYIPPPAPLPIEQPHNSYIPPLPVEQPHNTYIPPAPIVVEQPQNAYIPPAPEAGFTEDGYRYKTVRRVVHKNRS